MRRLFAETLSDDYIFTPREGSAPGTITFGPEETPVVIPVQTETVGEQVEIRLFPERSYRHQDLIKRIEREP